jgi:nuclear pore complex protein Nup54
LLKLIQHLHLLIPALRSSAIRPEEEALRVRLEEIEEEVRRGRLRGKLNELWAVVGALVNGARGGKEGGGSGTEWAVVDEDGLAQIAQVC